MRNDQSPSKVITISLDQETLDILECMTSSGKSRSYVIRESIRYFYDNYVKWYKDLGGNENE